MDDPTICTLCELTGQHRSATYLAWKRPTGAEDPSEPMGLVRVGFCDSHCSQVIGGEWPGFGFHAIHSPFDADARSWCPDCQDLFASRSRSSNRVAAGEGVVVTGERVATTPYPCSSDD
jgi:hypothetical protein